MHYQQTIDWLFTQLPMYQRQGKAAYKANLDNIHKLSDYLHNPHEKFKSIHVAGTNGKGSTAHMLASVLQEAGYNVGLYTSPHLKDFRERILINGKMISKKFVTGFVERNRAFFEANHLSFFEMTVGMAFEYFAKKKIDVAVVEVGLGGRLDSTNIITPEVSVITNIGIDHTLFLGDTLEKIAAEKAGIIKPTIPVVIGEYHKETFRVFEEVAKNAGAPLLLAEKEEDRCVKTDLLGDYQQKNIKTVLSTLQVLRMRGMNIPEPAIIRGLQKVAANTGILGRWQVLQEKPKVICDTAHNKEGLALVMRQLKKEDFRRLHIVLGVVNDKDLSRVLPLFPKKAIYYFCRAEISRGLDAKVLRKKANSINLLGKEYKSVKEALDAALKEADNRDVIYVGGSTFVVAEII